MFDASLTRIAARPRLSLLAGLTAGIVAAMGQAPFGFPPALVLGLFFGFALFRAARDARHAAVLGWALGAGYFGLTLTWIVQPFLVDLARHGWMAPFALILMAGGLALFWGAGAAMARWLTPRPYGWIAWPVALSTAELARGALFTGFPWGEPGLAWVDTPVAQLGAYVGTSGLTFLSFLLAAALYAALHAPRRGVMTATAAAFFFVALGLGVLRGQGPVENTGKTVRLIQPNAPQHLKWHPDYALEFLDRALDLTAEPGTPDLVIWPETSVPYLLDNTGNLLSEIAATAAPAPVVLGIQRGEGGRYMNSMVALDVNGGVSAIYDKHHLVPFGEYTPGGGLLHRLGLRGFAAQYGSGYFPGPGATVLDLGPMGKALSLICYEAIFARDLRAAPERADWILQITNDAWFGTFSGPQQHLVQARMRAIEMGLPFVRAANTGISAVIDPFGRITAAVGLNRTGKLDAALPAPFPETLYARRGDALLMIGLILAAAGLFLRRGTIPD
ncbi:apolipoprotein N-acyltransferase [Aliiroseovarius subalbicans]|uniref:apolipoprotein N-acyltransferase n=1 Tax=Aliiroseovarius subalbicans TaxID=2925840 RepID=UPI001F5A2323|nr:apolipoprotein N-acyltransferase [Aliiroseovarius subalbicans]MCI2400284.1 apolipoprotein N-acyltransferase [Aliiroseovarius subalbicans]